MPPHHRAAEQREKRAGERAENAPQDPLREAIAGIKDRCDEGEPGDDNQCRDDVEPVEALVEKDRFKKSNEKREGREGQQAHGHRRDPDGLKKGEPMAREQSAGKHQKAGIAPSRKPEAGGRYLSENEERGAADDHSSQRDHRRAQREPLAEESGKSHEERREVDLDQSDAAPGWRLFTGRGPRSGLRDRFVRMHHQALSTQRLPSSRAAVER